MSVLYHFLVIASCLSKIVDFILPNLHLAPVFGVTLFEFCGDLCCEKTTVTGLSCGHPVFSHFDTKLACDGWTDNQTEGHMMTANTVLA